MKLLVDEDTFSAALIARLIASGHEVVQLPSGTPDAVIFDEAQRLAVPILTANVGRKGRRDPVGLYRLAGVVQEQKQKDMKPITEKILAEFRDSQIHRSVRRATLS